MAALTLSGKKLGLSSDRNNIIGSIYNCDIFLNDHTVSQNHAIMKFVNDGVMSICDTDSLLGTKLGTMELPQHIPFYLEEGVSITFGNVNVIFNYKKFDNANSNDIHCAHKPTFSNDMYNYEDIIFGVVHIGPVRCIIPRESRFTVGGSVNCSIVLDTESLILATIEWIDSRHVVIYSCDKMHRTSLNEKELALHLRYLLRDGSKIMFGNVSAEFRIITTGDSLLRGYPEKCNDKLVQRKIAKDIANDPRTSSAIAHSRMNIHPQSPFVSSQNLQNVGKKSNNKSKSVDDTTHLLETTFKEPVDTKCPPSGESTIKNAFTKTGQEETEKPPINQCTDLEHSYSSLNEERFSNQPALGSTKRYEETDTLPCDDDDSLVLSTQLNDDSVQHDSIFMAKRQCSLIFPESNEVPLIHENHSYIVTTHTRLPKHMTPQLMTKERSQRDEISTGMRETQCHAINRNRESSPIMSISVHETSSDQLLSSIDDIHLMKTHNASKTKEGASPPATISFSESVTCENTKDMFEAATSDSDRTIDDINEETEAFVFNESQSKITYRHLFDTSLQNGDDFSDESSSESINLHPTVHLKDMISESVSQTAAESKKSSTSLASPCNERNMVDNTSPKVIENNTCFLSPNSSQLPPFHRVNKRRRRLVSEEMEQCERPSCPIMSSQNSIDGIRSDEQQDDTEFYFPLSMAMPSTQEFCKQVHKDRETFQDSNSHTMKDTASETANRSIRKRKGAKDSILTVEHAGVDKENVTNSRNSRVTPQEVKICIHLSHQRSILNKVMKLGGKVTDATEADVLVAKNLQQNENLLVCVARGIPIVSVLWIDRSAKQKKWLDPWENLMRDEATEKRLGFKLEDTLARAPHTNLLAQYHVYATSGTTPPPSSILYLADLCGAVVLEKMPRIWPSPSLIFSTEDDNSLWPPFDQNVDIVKVDCLFDAILRQSLDIKPYLLQKY